MAQETVLTTGNRIEPMAVVEPLRRADPADRGRADAGGVVRLVDFIGPISPELVLVDPELAGRARAFLPELPGSWKPAGKEDEPAPVPGPTSTSAEHRRMFVAVGATVVLVAGATLVGWLASSSGNRQATSGLPRPPAITSTPDAPSKSRTPAGTQPPPTDGHPQPTPTKTEPRSVAPIVAPRFVWPSRKSAVAYRVALFRDGAKVFEADVNATELELPGSWTYAGRLQQLTRATYRWVVWPLYGTRRAPRVGQPIVSSRYTA